MTASADGPMGRAEAFDRLRAGFATVADLGERLDGAADDRERRSVLLVLVTAAWELRDRATLAYEALVREGEAGGFARGVLE